MSTKIEKGMKCRLVGLQQKSLEGTKVKVLKVFADEAVVRALKTGEKYQVDFDNLKPIVKHTAPEPAPVVEAEPEVVEVTFTIGDSYMLQNCKNEELNGRIVTLLGETEEGKLRVEDADGNKFKVVAEKLAMIPVAEDEGIEEEIEEEPVVEEIEEEVELEDLQPEPEVEKVIPTIEEWLAGGNNEFVLTGCSMEELNGMSVTFLEWTEDGRARVHAANDKKYKVAKDKLVPLMPEVEAAPEAEVAADEEPTAKEKLEEAIGGPSEEIDKLEKFVTLISGIPYSELEMLITAHREGRVTIEESRAAEVSEHDAEALFRTHAPELGLDPNLFGSVILAQFSTGSREYIICGIKPGSPNPIIAIDKEGSKQWFRVDFINKCLANQPAAEPAEPAAAEVADESAPAVEAKHEVHQV